MKNEEEKLGKVVALARGGIGGEKENAIKIVKRMCERLGLDFETVMIGGEKVSDYNLEIKRGTYKLAVQIVARYGLTEKSEGSFWANRRKTSITFECTAEQYFETVNAYEILCRMYKAEQVKMRRALFYGFLEKHDLFYQYKKGSSKDRKMTKEERDARIAGSALAEHMDDANLRKTLPVGKK